jgi:hypothetical protein
MQQAVGKRRLAVVNVGDDAEISYVCGVHLQIVESRISNCEPERSRITGKRLKKRKFASAAS